MPLSRRRLIQVTGAVFVVSATLPAAVRGDEVLYVGGTLEGLKEKTTGRLDATGAVSAIFTAKKASYAIPFKTISSLEYGQKAGRRVGVALAVSPLFLLSKKRRHYLSIGYVDEKGAKQGAVLEIGKGRTRSIISALETKSGKKVEFESDDAQKHYEKGAN